ncbi:HD domain-containing protein [Patescibacteria group bacterium]|nr:HD domain-containing protein [Patescibacteria group bacterium]
MTERFFPASGEDHREINTRINTALSQHPWAKIPLSLLEKYDEATYHHSLNTGYIMTRLALRNPLSKDDDAKATVAGFLHDVGKTKVSPELLRSGVVFNQEEENPINEHVRRGVDIVSKYDCRIAAIIAAHHEFQDKPYPRADERPIMDLKLRQMQIMLAIADHAESLLSKRSYKEPWPEQNVVFHLKHLFGSGSLPLIQEAVVSMQLLAA